MKSEIKEVKKVNIFSVAKIAVLFAVVFGLIYGVTNGLSYMQNPIGFNEVTSFIEQYVETYGSSPDYQSVMAGYTLALGWWMIIIAPIIFALVYFVSGLVVGLLYNWFAKLVGGVKVSLN